MKILVLNCNPDTTYLINHGINVQTDFMAVSVPLQLKYLYPVRDTNGNVVNMYTPDVEGYLETIDTTQYSIIYYGWNPNDYGSIMEHSGGYTCPTPLSSGAIWCSVRNDSNFLNYFNHETMHALRIILNTKFNLYPKDIMDMTPTPKGLMPYYENNFTILDSFSNFNQEWAILKPFIAKLNSITYMKKVTLTRNSDNGIEALGILTCEGFTSKTLERPWQNNQNNISCIPKGTYVCKWTFSPRLLRYTYEVQNVPNRSGVRLHSGNYFFDVEGCILLGDSYGDINKDRQTDILNSKATIAKFEALMAKQSFNLIIK